MCKASLVPPKQPVLSILVHPAVLTGPTSTLYNFVDKFTQVLLHVHTLLSLLPPALQCQRSPAGRQACMPASAQGPASQLTHSSTKSTTWSVYMMLTTLVCHGMLALS